MMNEQPKSAALLFLLTLFVFVAADFRQAADAKGEPLEWLSLRDAQEQAVSEDKMVFVFVEATWCVICRRMREEVFTDSQVRALMEDRFLPVSIDVDDESEVAFNGDKFTERGLARALKVTGTPTMIFLDQAGEIVGWQPGFVDAGRFESILRYVDSDDHGRVPFEAYLEEHAQ